jgi:ribose/xylose/arabinose/galactoside ABC-type transport system permease subunit
LDDKEGKGMNMKAFLKRNSKESSLLLICVLVFVSMSLLSPGGYLSVSNFSSMMSQLPEFGLLAFAMMMIILTGGIDLSLTYICSLSGIIMASVMSNLYAIGIPVPAAVFTSCLAGLAIAVCCGLLNGFLVARLHVSSILATLGTSMLFKGIGMNITKGRAVSGFPPEFSTISNGMIGGIIPYSLIIFAVLALIAWILLERTPWGVRLHMVGSNEVAMSYSGTNVRKLLFQVYAVSAIFCLIASIIMMSRYNSMKVDYGSSYLMQSILATVLGGTVIVGGYGKVGGTVLSVVTIQFLSSGLSIFGVKQSFVDIFMGVLLIVVLTINFVVDSAQRKNMLRKIRVGAAGKGV